MRRDPITKQGEYGPLYRYAIRYVDDCDPDNTGVWHCWAYSAEHALERFYDGPDEGWSASQWCRMVDGPSHVQTWHEA